MTLQERFERGEDETALEVPNRIGRVDGDDLSDDRPESKPALFVDELKLSFWTIPYAIASKFLKKKEIIKARSYQGLCLYNRKSNQK